MDDDQLDIMLYTITGVYGFLLLFLIAFVIHLNMKVSKLMKDDEDDDDKSDIRSAPRQLNQSDFSLPKPMLSKSGPHSNKDLPRRNYGQSEPPEMNYGHSNDGEFDEVDFNNRMMPDRSFKSSSTEEGSFKNPLFNQVRSELERKYDYVDPRDKHHSKPPVPSFKPHQSSNNYNQPNNYNHLYPKRDQQNNDYRY